MAKITLVLNVSEQAEKALMVALGQLTPSPHPTMHLTTSNISSISTHRITLTHIRAYRRRMGLNQTELGRRIGTCTATISRYERGLPVKVETAKAIAQALHTTISSLR